MRQCIGGEIRQPWSGQYICLFVAKTGVVCIEVTSQIFLFFLVHYKLILMQRIIVWSYILLSDQVKDSFSGTGSFDNVLWWRHFVISSYFLIIFFSWGFCPPWLYKTVILCRCITLQCYLSQYSNLSHWESEIYLRIFNVLLYFMWEHILHLFSITLFKKFFNFLNKSFTHAAE
jgi:hypothetical protein